jgi:hypothetical protein
MSVFDNNIKSETVTETILRYACDIFKEKNPNADPSLEAPWHSGEELYKRIINKRPYARTSVIDNYINLGRDRYYEKTGRYYKARLVMWPTYTYLYDCVQALVFDEVEKPR